MIALYIVLGLFFLIALFLFSSIRFVVSYKEDFSVLLGFWFLRFKLYPEKQVKKQKESKSDSEPTRKTSKLKQMIRENGLKNTLSKLFDTVKVVFNSLSKISKHIRIRRLKLIVTAATEDPALTGVEYGAFCSVVFPFVKFLQDFANLNEKGANVSVRSDFLATKPTLELYSVIKIRVIYILSFGISAFIELVKQNIVKMNEEPKIKAETNGGQEK